MNISWIATTLIVVMILLILWSLGAGLFYLVRDRGKSDKTLKALIFRITLSIILFLALILAYVLGWIRPHPLF